PAVCPAFRLLLPGLQSHTHSGTGDHPDPPCRSLSPSRSSHRLTFQFVPLFLSELPASGPRGARRSGGDPRSRSTGNPSGAGPAGSTHVPVASRNAPAVSTDGVYVEESEGAICPRIVVPGTGVAADHERRCGADRGPTEATVARRRARGGHAVRRRGG